ncbi:bifunctional ornithine acetyltransferase/N-acetylglutamate synthase [Spirochaeta isovalerica]|uniref:Arginine biosynthesis bifunctional protein ArgJ n=1 Tax=Spirochaeta isovalerica TaxID=150 RepID=A0A841R7W9_9SPIO|nr:bifunctional ornithine acetyltransferase/N-acetylglutamate synthase [Spirochaeta isovalerica]MBB6479471.1 glutamate N-acetyltransferase/amino-acid N-acetyltransferase [Spirochaeta isovalerica]
MEEFTNQEEYAAVLQSRGVLPEGFSTSVQDLEFFPAERETAQPMKMKLTLIEADEPVAAFAGVFTRNAFPGHPVTIGRDLLSSEKVSGVIINNRISNVRCEKGRETALAITSALRELRGREYPYFPSSTGIIGWKLPEKEILENLSPLAEKLTGGNIFPAAQSIMTTDAFPKVRSVELGDGRICAIAKGAGMIEPNMATMLVFILTDLDVSREDLRDMFPEIIDSSFNRISVDSDQSTSDTALIFSSTRKSCPSVKAFRKALQEVCSKLAEDVVRNGEGTSHVIRVTVEGAADDKEACELGKNLINSPLSKAAVFGNDPNVGRFIQAMGDYYGNRGMAVDPESVTMELGGETIYRNGFFTLDEEKEVKLSNYMKDCSFINSEGFPPHERSVELKITLKRGIGRSSVLGSDLTYEYVRENADYRT